MNFDVNDLKKLAPGLITAIVLAALGAAAVYWTLQASSKAERKFQLSQARFAEADRRLREVNREEEEIRANSARYQALVDRGVIGLEQRLEWVELIADIRKARRLFDIDYEYAPQQLLPGSSSPFLFHASTMKFRLPLLHEGDLFRFLEDLSSRAPAHVQPRQCTIERVASPATSNLAPHLNGSCTLRWITIRDERLGGARS
jgi:hypothetical protein